MRATTASLVRTPPSKELKYWIRLEVEGADPVEVPLEPDEGRSVGSAIWHDRWVHPEAGETARDILAAAGIAVEGAALMAHDRHGVETALVARAGEERVVVRHRGFEPVVIGLWCEAPLFIAEGLATALRAPERGKATRRKRKKR